MFQSWLASYPSKHEGRVDKQSLYIQRFATEGIVYHKTFIRQTKYFYKEMISTSIS